MIRVLVVDDHAVVREGLKRILALAGDISVAAEAGSAEEGLEKARATALDVVVTDISMPGRSGLDLLRDIKAFAPKLPVLVLTVHGEEEYALRSLKSGASGYLTKESAPDELVAAIRKVVRGGRYVSAALADRLARRIDRPEIEQPHEALSHRELQVLGKMGKGRTITEIAVELKLSVKTVSTYRTRILEKTGLQSTAEIIAYAVRNGLVG